MSAEMFSVLPRRGRRTRAATKRISKTMEMADGAAFEAPGAPFEFRIAFEKAAAKEILTRVDGDKLGSESHHTPPKWALPGAGILQRRSPGVAFRKPAPSSQGVEVRASSGTIGHRRTRQVPVRQKRETEIARRKIGQRRPSGGHYESRAAARRSSCTGRCKFEKA